MFSINETLSKEDITVTFTPDLNVTKYTYKVYKNNDLVSSISISLNKSVDIVLDSTGRYIINVETFDGVNTSQYKSDEYIVDKDAPEIRVIKDTLSMRTKDKLNVSAGVKAKDSIDGDVTSSITSNISELNLKTTGKKKLIYTVSDKAGNTSSKEVTINVIADNTYFILIIQFIIIMFLLMIINKTNKYLHSILLEKRFAKYAIEEEESRSISLFDVIKYFYVNLVKSLGIVLNKSAFLKKYAKHYDKYSLIFPNGFTSIDIVGLKILSAIAFLMIGVTAKVIQYRTFSFYGVLLPLLLGFFTIDVIYIFKYKIYRDRIENDLLQAVIIMNNAFKLGRSIVQAIELVSTELPGIIGNQFKTMRYEISKGLSVEVVFDRFAKRINVEEANYLTASLTILNKTGGNIIKVFTAIESSLFMKKKLRLELNSLTSSSKVIMWVLFLVPILYIILISILNPAYFEPFINTSVGIVLAFVAAIFYIIYIIIVRKILKVRM